MISLACIAIIAIFSLFGCGGPAFTPDRPFRAIDKVPEGKALIYFYRPPETQTADLPYPVYRVQGKGRPLLITVLYNGGYYPYVTDPGDITLYAKSAIRRHRDAVPTQAIALKLRPGDIRYVRTYSGGTAAAIGMPKAMVPVKREVGEEEIKACFLIPEAPAPKPTPGSGMVGK